MKKILVTGGAGFIGSAFVRKQLRENDDIQIVVLDKLTYSGNLENLNGADPSRLTFIPGDIAEAKDVRQAMKGCDAVVNFAAESHVDRSLQGQDEFIRTNITGVNTLLQAAKDFEVERFLQVSTDEVYGSTLDDAFVETDPLNPRNPYSASKASGELFARAYFETYGLPVIITRGSNTYGPCQYPEKVLPLFVTNAIDGEPLPLYGDGKNVRDWLYVDDHCAGIEHALLHGTPGEVYNIAGGNERENIQLTQRILDHTDRDETLIRWVPDRTGHDRRYAIDATKLSNLGWSPSKSWDEGVLETVHWYQENEHWWRKIKSGEFREYYLAQYRDALQAAG